MIKNNFELWNELKKHFSHYKCIQHDNNCVIIVRSTSNNLKTIVDSQELIFRALYTEHTTNIDDETLFLDRNLIVS